MDALAEIVEQAQRDCPVCIVGGDACSKTPRITIAGVGGAGCNTLNELKGIESAMTLAINTDIANLRSVDAHKRILIATNSTLGAGGSPEIGMKCAEENKDEIAKALEGTELLFIAAGLGGGTGTGAAPVVAEVAKGMGATVIAMATYPFTQFEKNRKERADWGLDALFRSCDTVVVLDQNRLVELVPNITFGHAVLAVNSIVARSLRGIADSITCQAMVKLGVEDVRAIATNGGLGTVALGQGSGNFKVEDAVKTLFKSPMLDATLKEAKGALVHITGGQTVGMAEVQKAADRIRKEFSPKTAVAIGAHADPRLVDKMIITAVATGVKSAKIKPKETLADAEKETLAMEIAAG